jgi:DNA-directed RNA polymerase specialized sigma subunit
MTEIGIIFGVSQPRISQIVRDTYGEMKQIELERLYLESLELGE